MIIIITIMVIIIIIIIIIVTWTFIGKEFLGQLHKVSKNNFTSHSGALPQYDKITNYYTSG